jgi:hypothetical protein
LKKSLQIFFIKLIAPDDASTLSSISSFAGGTLTISTECIILLSSFCINHRLQESDINHLSTTSDGTKRTADKGSKKGSG